MLDLCRMSEVFYAQGRWLPSPTYKHRSLRTNLHTNYSTLDAAGKDRRQKLFGRYKAK